MDQIDNTIEMSQSAMQTKKANMLSKVKDQEFSQINQFLFQGQEEAFLESVGKMSQAEIQLIEVCNISIIGEEIKPGSPKVLFLTIILGFCLIFPFFFFCCQWWKRAVSQIFQIKQEVYVGLAKILKSKKLQSVSLTIYDNYLTKNKVNLILKNLRKRKMQRFVFVNEAGAFDMNNEEYSEFQTNIKPFSALSIKKWHISWYKKSLENQQINN